MVGSIGSETKVALITGAARGIGLATAKCLMQDGFRVVMVDRDRVALDDAAREFGAEAIALCHDVSIPEQVEQMIATAVANFGRLDALINNAGVADFGPLEDTDFARWREVMATNLDGVFLCSQAATPALKTSQGCIVNVASISGLRASTLRVAYGTSKAAVIHLTQQQAVELGEHGVRVNCVAPGPVRTKLRWPCTAKTSSMPITMQFRSIVTAVRSRSPVLLLFYVRSAPAT